MSYFLLFSSFVFYCCIVLLSLFLQPLVFFGCCLSNFMFAVFLSLLHSSVFHLLLLLVCGFLQQSGPMFIYYPTVMWCSIISKDRSIFPNMQIYTLILQRNAAVLLIQNEPVTFTSWFKIRGVQWCDKPCSLNP